MSVIVRNGDQLRIANLPEIQDKLPVGVYLLCVDEGGFYLQQKEEFRLPKKVYGDHSIVDRYLTAFENAPKNMGVLLSGIKGSGKTITAQKICINSGKPVIMIMNSFSGTGFTNFITSPVLGKSIIFIDEFEKVYNTEKDSTITDGLLSLMDGQYPTRLLFLLTVNKQRISEYLVNRLGRLKYRKHYDNLEADVIEEVIEDLLVNKEHKESIYLFLDKLGMCTFDILVYTINEMNLFKENALDCAKHFNLEIEPQNYKVTHRVGDNVVEYGYKDINFGGEWNHYRSQNISTTLRFEDNSLDIDFVEERKHLKILRNGIRTFALTDEITERVYIDGYEDKKGQNILIDGEDRRIYGDSKGTFYQKTYDIETELVFEPSRTKLMFTL